MNKRECRTMINRVSLDDREMGAVFYGLMLLAEGIDSFNQSPVTPILVPPWHDDKILTAVECRDLAQRLHTGVDA
jgi:hypothetical protein